MRWLLAVVVLLALAAMPLAAQEARWIADASVIGAVEAWDLNDQREQLHGGALALNARVWRGLAIRAEALRLLVGQRGADAWLTAAWLGARVQRRTGSWQPFGELGGGRGAASQAVPPNGTRWNYVIVAGAGVEFPLAGPHLVIGARWLHVSNNGSEGRSRNPDIQALGGQIGLRWALR